METQERKEVRERTAIQDKISQEVEVYNRGLKHITINGGYFRIGGGSLKEFSVNWSALGNVETKRAREFIRMLEIASDICDNLNKKYEHLINGGK